MLPSKQFLNVSVSFVDLIYQAFEKHLTRPIVKLIIMGTIFKDYTLYTDDTSSLEQQITGGTNLRHMAQNKVMTYIHFSNILFANKLILKTYTVFKKNGFPPKYIPHIYVSVGNHMF